MHDSENIVVADNSNDSIMLINAKGDKTPLNLGWGDEEDANGNSFTVVRSRKKGKEGECGGF